MSEDEKPKRALFIAMPRFQNRVMDQIGELVELDCLSAIHLHTSPINAKRIQIQCQQRAFPDSVKLHVAPGAHRGPVNQLMMNLAEQMTSDTEPGEAIIISPYTESRTTIEWLEERKIPAQFHPELHHLALAEIAGINLIAVDRAAKTALRQLRRRHGKAGWHKEVSLSEWSERFWHRLGGAPERPYRRAMMGTAHFKVYVTLLGMTPLNGMVHMSQVPHRRPVRKDLVTLYDNLVAEQGRCLFLHWCNRLLQQFPNLQSSFVRKMLFGSSNMERIAQSVGLIRKKQRLHLAIPIHRNFVYGNREHRKTTRA